MTYSLSLTPKGFGRGVRVSMVSGTPGGFGMSMPTLLVVSEPFEAQHSVCSFLPRSAEDIREVNISERFPLMARRSRVMAVLLSFRAVGKIISKHHNTEFASEVSHLYSSKNP